MAEKMDLWLKRILLLLFLGVVAVLLLAAFGGGLFFIQLYMEIYGPLPL